MLVRVQLIAHLGFNCFNRKIGKNALQLPQNQFQPLTDTTIAHPRIGLLINSQGHFQAVFHSQKFPYKPLQGEFARIGDLSLSPFADVVDFRLGPQITVLIFGNLIKQSSNLVGRLCSHFGTVLRWRTLGVSPCSRLGCRLSPTAGDGADVDAILGSVSLGFIQFQLINDLTGSYFIVLLGIFFAGSSHGELGLAC